jgi:hypothetical protein
VLDEAIFVDWRRGLDSLFLLEEYLGRFFVTAVIALLIAAGRRS